MTHLFKTTASQYQYRKAEEHLQMTGDQASPGQLASVGMLCSVRAALSISGPTGVGRRVVKRAGLLSG